MSTRDQLLYFCDESHIRGSEYFSVGGLAVRPKTASIISQKMQEIRSSNGLGSRDSEVQWKSAKLRRNDIYRRYVDLLHDLTQSKQVHLHIRFTPSTTKVGGNKPEDISKAFYQLLLHRAGRYYADKCDIRVRPDNGCCTDYLPKMLRGLNGDVVRKKFGTAPNSFSSIVPANSRSEPILQLLDVTLGALTSARNNNHKNGTLGPYKTSLADYVLEKFMCDLTKNTNSNASILSVWNVSPKQ